ncbi:MAG: glycosyltransferase family 87 protein [Candidatus Thorarchaeota archaeon]
MVRSEEVLMVLVVVLNFAVVLALRQTGAVMYPFFILVYAWTFAYAALVALLLRMWRTRRTPPMFHGSRGMVCIVVMTLALRLIMIDINDLISLDPLWYLDFGKFMRSGLRPYFGFYFPYPPVFAYVILALTYVSPTLHSLRLLSASLDCIVAILLWRLAERTGMSGQGALVALAYAFLPLSVLESGWNAHFEPLVNVLVLLAVWFLLENRHRLSGVMLGLAVATKVYPLFALPLMLLYLRGRRTRAEFTMFVLGAGVLTFIPIALLELLCVSDVVPPGPSISLESIIAFALMFIGLHNILVPTALLSLACVVAAYVTVMRVMTDRCGRIPGMSYLSVSFALGVIIALLGIVAATYPLLPISKVAYWRYPADVGIVRGASTSAAGLCVAYFSWSDRRTGRRRTVSVNDLLILVMGVVFLLTTMIRDVFYGWYLLWSIPLFLLMRDRRTGIIVVLSLLLLHPGYTHDSFVSSGLPEQRTWVNDFETAGNWTVSVNSSIPEVDPASVHAGVDIEGGVGRYWFDTTSVENTTLLANVTILFTTCTEIPFDTNTDFVVRIGSSWNPTFGQLARFQLDYRGLNTTGGSINGTIVASTGIFTNLTFILWTHSIGFWNTDPAGGVITELIIIIFPQRSVRAEYVIDYMCTVDMEFPSLANLLVILLTGGLSLAACIIIIRELRHDDMVPPNCPDVERRSQYPTQDSEQTGPT